MKINRKIKTKDRVGLAVFALSFFSIFLFFFAIFQVIDTNDMRYEKISKINFIKNIKIENEKLEIQLAKLKNSQNLKESAANLNMVSVLGVSYVGVSGGDVAFNGR